MPAAFRQPIPSSPLPARRSIFDARIGPNRCGRKRGEAGWTASFSALMDPILKEREDEGSEARNPSAGTAMGPSEPNAGGRMNARLQEFKRYPRTDNAAKGGQKTANLRSPDESNRGAPLDTLSASPRPQFEQPGWAFNGHRRVPLNGSLATKIRPTGTTICRPSFWEMGPQL